MTKRDAQAAEYAEEQSQVAAARQMESQIFRTWQARQRARAKSGDLLDRLEQAAGYALMDAARGTVREAAEQIARLRLTDAEREAIRRLSPSGDPLASRTVTLTPEERRVFHGLLERLGGGR
jgi:hypothetical protein